jgi:hypothetical protein
MTSTDHTRQPSTPDEPAQATGVAGLVHDAAALFGVQPSAFFQSLIAVVGAAVGNAVKLQIPVVPGPLNLALACVICEEGAGRMARALDFLLQPLRDFQDRRLLRLTEQGRHVVEREIARLEAACGNSRSLDGLDDRPEDRAVERLAGLRRSLRPLVLAEEPRPGELAASWRAAWMEPLPSSCRARPWTGCSTRLAKKALRIGRCYATVFSAGVIFVHGSTPSPANPRFSLRWLRSCIVRRTCWADSSLRKTLRFLSSPRRPSRFPSSRRASRPRSIPHQRGTF